MITYLITTPELLEVDPDNPWEEVSSRKPESQVAIDWVGRNCQLTDLPALQVVYIRRPDSLVAAMFHVRAKRVVKYASERVGARIFPTVPVR